METYDRLVEKWSPVLNEESAGSITDAHKRSVTAAVLENTEKALQEQGLQEVAANAAGAGTAATGAADNWNPILISLVRRAMPNMMAYDVAGVQPMSGPTGLIFAMKSNYKTTKAGVSVGDEALFNEAAVGFSGDSATTANGSPSGLAGVTDTDGGGSIVDSGSANVPYTGDAYTTAEAEGLGVSGGEAFSEMGFSIEKATVTAKSRALKAEYTLELAQDLKAIHGLDAETELANILSAEILAEINREVVRTIYIVAKKGAQVNTTTAGIFDLDTDSNGRWSVEKFKGLLFAIERDANAVGQQTRRGKGNIIICSADVASALQMAGVLDYTPALNSNLNVDDTANTFAGTLNGRYKVYVDPYAANVSASQYYVVGYRGSSPYDAGIFYCPYVPLQMVRAVGEDTFQPKIGFKTRYGITGNPYASGVLASGTAAGDVGALDANDNVYYRRVKVTNLM